jgi:hypothetical protein
MKELHRLPWAYTSHIQMDRYGVTSRLDSYEQGLASGKTSKALHKPQRTEARSR